jgi:hypothetical protein
MQDMLSLPFQNWDGFAYRRLVRLSALLDTTADTEHTASGSSSEAELRLCQHIGGITEMLILREEKRFHGHL